MSSDNSSDERTDGPDEPAGVGVGRDALPHDVDALRSQVRRLEAGLAEYRSQEELLNKTFVSATAFAERVMEEARRDAELTLQEARVRADEVLGGIEEEKRAAEGELVRLRSAVQETRETLSTFLTTAIEGLQAELDATGSGPVPAGGLDDALRGVLDDTLRTETALPPSLPPKNTGA